MPNLSLRVPAFCPVCGGLMKGNRSTFTFYDYGCCIDCHIWFLEGRPEKITKWKEGWRPNVEELEVMRASMKD